MTQVYTVSQESRYLLVQGVPALGAHQELVKQFALYGTIQEYNVLDQYPAEEYTEVFLFKFQNTQSARCVIFVVLQPKSFKRRIVASHKAFLS